MAADDVLLIIKGNFEQARAALDKHGLCTVQALDVGRRTLDNNVVEVRAWVHRFDLEHVVRWFCENSNAFVEQFIPGEGFKPGTLLYYHVEH